MATLAEELQRPKSSLDDFREICERLLNYMADVTAYIRITKIFSAFLILFPIQLVGKDVLFTIQYRQAQPSDSEQFVIITEQQTWHPNQTAIIICDMWDQHWCRGATDRVAELAPAINAFISAGRNKGILIIHAPSSVVNYYRDHPARKNARAAPKAENIPKNMADWCHSIEGEDVNLWPIDQSDGGCDCSPACEQGSPWRKQIETIEIKKNDIISDSGIEVWNVFEERGIQNVILVGVHTNMCVIGRPFGLRNMKRVGKNVVLCRDLTDTMYNSRKKPFVSHFEGTELIIEYIEKYICPTISSTDLRHEPAFQFKDDRK